MWVAVGGPFRATAVLSLLGRDRADPTGMFMLILVCIAVRVAVGGPFRATAVRTLLAML